jgi:hypothetical protein
MPSYELLFSVTIIYLSSYLFFVWLPVDSPYSTKSFYSRTQASQTPRMRPSSWVR